MNSIVFLGHIHKRCRSSIDLYLPIGDEPSLAASKSCKAAASMPVVYFCWESCAEV